MILHGPSRPELLRDETLPDIAEATAHVHATHVALIDGGRNITYGELDAAADRLAHRLITAGAGTPGRIIGLWLPRGADLLIAQLGIAKSGAAWLPFDADTPPERVATCLRDAGAVALVTDAAGSGRLPTPPATTVFTCRELLAALPPGEIPRRRDGLTAAHSAYVIYTSGSTGKPKGIAVSHGSICHFLRSENALLGIASSDRVYQGFSVAFDMSFEEVWISYLVGASLWIAPKAVTSDPDALQAALHEHRISVLHTVPSLLALLPEAPASLRLINLGGEACPQSLADRWAVAPRRVFNTYGPTETTVSATAAELHAGEAVTIGRPLPNYGLAIVDEHLQPVAAGAAGELVVFGPGLAIGYLARPELTRDRYPLGPFPGLPGVTRLYRTGDQVRLDADGDLRFLGRVDDQVKVRGYRVELGEIEAAIAVIAGIRAAAVVLRQDAGDAGLVAFVVADGIPDPAALLRRQLLATLPNYMVPGRFISIDTLPRLASGKVDRTALRSLALPAQAAAASSDQPATPAETALAAAIAVLFPGRAFRREDDFFDDLGGHSLTAARLVSCLRDRGFPRAAVREVYAHRQLGAIARALAAGRSDAVVASRPTAPPRRSSATRRWLCGLVQFLLLPVPVCTHLAMWLAPFFTYHYFTGDEEDSVLVAVGMATLVLLLAQVAAFTVAIVAKWLVLGRLRPGRYPLWGATHVRWWFTEMLAHAAPIYLLNGTPLYRLYLRALGARVGRDVAIGSVDVAAPDLLTIGDHAALGSAVRIANVRVEHGHLLVGSVAIGAGTLVDSYAVLEEDTAVGDDATLGQLSALPAHAVIPGGEIWEGVPARRTGAAPANPAPLTPGRLRWLAEWLFYPLAGGLVSAIFFLPVFPAFMLIDWLDAQWLDTYGNAVHILVATGVYLVLGIPAGAVLVLVTLFAAAALRWLVSPRLAPGSWPVHGATYYRKWITGQIQENSLHLLHGLFATIYAPLWFRLIGAKVGRHAEISTAVGVTPELLSLGDDSFVADGAMVGDELIRSGVLTLAGTSVGARSFIGNGACVPDGTHVPADVLIGVQSISPATGYLASGQTWMGNPPISLPARETHAGFPVHLTFRPSPWRRVARGSVELVRIVVPLAGIIAFGYLAVRVIMPLFEDEEWLLGLGALTVAGFVYGLASLLVVLAAKWLLIGRYRPRAAPMWTPFVWVSEAVTAVYESLAVPNFLDFLRGTPLLPFFLRLFGARIGRGVFLDTTDLTEFDCVEIGDGAELNADCGPQTHLFEDRIMKIGQVRIGAGACVGVRSTILYDSEVGDGVHLGPLTLVAKGERLPAGTAWTGSPAAPG